MDEFKTFTMRMDKELNRKARIYAINNDINLQELLTKLLQEFLDENK